MEEKISVLIEKCEKAEVTLCLIIQGLQRIERQLEKEYELLEKEIKGCKIEL